LSYATEIVCVMCDGKYPLTAINFCPHCGKPGEVDARNWTIEVEYDWERIKREVSKEDLKDTHSLWRYLPLLPVNQPDLIVSLGEGMTPLSKCRNLEKLFGIKDLYIKDETQNPTGSFKDRMIAVTLQMARELGKHTVLIVSDGNLGSSGAAFCAKSGDMRCYIMTYPHITEAKLLQMQIYGGQVINVEATIAERVQLLMELEKREGWYVINNDHIGNPYAVEGYKTIGYEIAEQLNWQVPDHVVVPTGSGEGISGVYKGFKELYRLGWIDRIPKIHAVQIEGNDPLVRAVLAKAGFVESLPEMRETVVGGINTDATAQTALHAVRESGGTGVTIADEEALLGESLMASREAVYTEPASGAGMYAVKKLIENKVIKPSESCVCVVTSFGLKDIQATKMIVKEPALIKGKVEEFDQLFLNT
jgi:threonine synthase